MTEKLVRLKNRLSKGGAVKICLGVVLYLGLLLSYLGPVLPNCSERFIGGPGDETAFSWLYMASPDSPPLWGQTSWTNAPYGEDLHEPTYISGLVQYTAAWLITKVVSPNCSFNVLMSSGFLFTAIITFLFLLWLTGRKSYFAAWFGGYVVAFSPYLTAKTPYHISYVFCGLLIAILWLLMALWRRWSYKLAACLMAITALIFYFDPYFILLVLVMYLCFFGTLVLCAMKKRYIWTGLGLFIKRLLILSPIFLILIAPLVYTRIAYSNQITNVVENSRDSDIIQEGLVYGARPWEYIYPSTYNPLLPDSLRQYKLDHQHGSNPAETTLYIGFVPILLTLWLAFVWWRKRTDIESLETPLPVKMIVVVSSLMIVIAGALSLLPRAKVFGLELHFPSDLLLSLTSMWRVPARLSVIVQIGFAVMCTFALILIIRKLRERKIIKIFILALVLIISLAEYLPFDPLHRFYWGYKDVPKVYDDIKNNNTVDRIAEYPMLDAPRNYAFIYYLTYQGYHRKEMINSAKTASPTKKYRESMADLYDWQTLGALKRLGVDRVVVHGDLKDSSLPAGLKKVGSSRDSVAHTTVSTYEIDDTVAPKSYLLVIGSGFDGPSNYGYSEIGYYMHGTGVISPVALPNIEKKEKIHVRIEMRSTDKDRSVQFMQEDKVIKGLNITPRNQVVDLYIDSTAALKIIIDNGQSDATAIIDNMEAN